MAFGYWTMGNVAVNPKDTSQKIFVISRGESIREIGNSLKKEGLIRDSVVFFIYLKLKNQDKNIQAGDYRLSPSMSLPKIVENLNHGILDIWVTIPEGLRAEEIAELYEKNLPSYDSSWRASLIANEGYLFPDTYLIPKDADVPMVISMMRNNFNKKIGEIGLSPESPSIPKLIKIASLIEREAITDEEKPLISGIIKNRLDLGMGLDIDATLQYAKGKVGGKWWSVPTGDDRKIVSSYNTYLNPGLPPTPIANPGIEAIRAAANPQDTPYLYYIHAKGKIYPARTIQEHNANVQKYL